ncbi:hypothetical protein BKA56DRAFT_606841, partial [Ilyonectria sp. MPI-CAGE-AT-0026]
MLCRSLKGVEEPQAKVGLGTPGRLSELDLDYLPPLSQCCRRCRTPTLSRSRGVALV